MHVHAPEKSLGGRRGTACNEQCNTGFDQVLSCLVRPGPEFHLIYPIGKIYVVTEIS